MDDKAETHIRELCTRIGSIMEDASVVALVWSRTSELSVEARLQLLRTAHDEIGRLISQAEGLLGQSK